MLNATGAGHHVVSWTSTVVLIKALKEGHALDVPCYLTAASKPRGAVMSDRLKKELEQFDSILDETLATGDGIYVPKKRMLGAPCTPIGLMARNSWQKSSMTASSCTQAQALQPPHNI